MTNFLTSMLGRLPIGWLQLTHNRTRLFAAIAGVAFANILVFMQLGFLGALIESIKLPYDQMNADILILASDTNTMSDGSPIPRQRMLEALSVPGVSSATPVFLSKLEWKQSDGTIRSMDIFGVDPAAKSFRSEKIAQVLNAIALPDRGIIDRKTRNVPKEIFENIDNGTPLVFETRGRTLSITDTFTIGGGLVSDGYIIVSDQTFLKLFPQRVSGAPDHIFVTLENRATLESTITKLRDRLPAYDTIVASVREAVGKDQNFQTTQKPVGLIFGFGVIIGIMVGIIIVYQVLSTDVADHLREYATFKAIGYQQSFFVSIIIEEAIILAVFGFIPGVLISLGLYQLVIAAAGLPMAMTGLRLAMVFFGTIIMCSLSGIIATRRLTQANPADLF